MTFGIGPLNHFGETAVTYMDKGLRRHAIICIDCSEQS